ncbi:hypothetical protein DSL72_006196 [Monilinia vaccinii-corymbosi]|uniref:Uncharacterized protein n=1 Tax=Monilinia vaccinii-corymbosi TaxID=61207 RepID=A0A8A3PH24_9HELO|nr:hypothetical protein DSL72_006196 [Monilinia vaccinii-corymbosi]
MPHDTEGHPKPKGYVEGGAYGDRRRGSTWQRGKRQKADQSTEMPSMMQRIGSGAGGVPSEAVRPHISTRYAALLHKHRNELPTESRTSGSNSQRRDRAKKQGLERRRRGSAWGSLESDGSEVAKQSTETSSAIQKPGMVSPQATLLRSTPSPEQATLEDESPTQSPSKPRITFEIEDYKRPSASQLKWADNAWTENGVNSQVTIDQMFKRFKWHPDLLMHPQ